MSKLTPPFSVKSIYEYKSDHDDDLSFPAGVVITVTDIEDDDWYSGELDGKTGIFPKNFVKVLESPIKPPRPSESSIGKGTPELQHNMGLEPPVAESSPLHPLADEESLLKSKSVKSDVEEEKVPETVSTEKAYPENTARPPIPDMSAKKQNDSYNIKKQFLASGKSSYIPPIKPRDESKIVGHMRQDVVDGQDIVKSTDYSEKKKEDVEPKLTLKERISLLQQQQKEQAEREAAVLKRQQERKHKMEQKEKLQQERQATPPLEDTEGMSEKQLERQDSGKPPIEPEVSVSTQQEDFVPTNVDRLLSHKDDSVQAADKDMVKQENQEGDALDTEGASEDEYLRRKRLVERMAKISGGRNMFGMMGIPPFAPSAREDDKSKEPDIDEPAEEEKEEEAEGAEGQSTRAQAVPIMPFANPDALPNSLANKLNLHHNEVHEDDGDSDSYEFQDTKEVMHPEDEDEASPNVDPLEKSKEHEESFSRSKASADETFEETFRDEEKTIPKPMNYEDAAGYEADEDLSDKPKNDNFVNEQSTRELHEGPNTSKFSSPTIPPPMGPPPLGPPPVVPSRVPNVHKIDPPLQENDTQSYQDEVAPKLEKVDVDDLNTYPELDSSEEANTTQEHHFKTMPPPVPPVPTFTDSRNVELDDDFGNTKEIDHLHGSSVPARANTVPELRTSYGVGNAHPSGPGEAPKVPPPIPQANIDSIKRTSTELPQGSHRKSIDTISSKRSHHIGSAVSPTGEQPLSHEDLSYAMKGRSKSHAQSQADVTLGIIEYEIANISETSSWWLKGKLPESLTAKIGSELIYEIDTNEIIKRGGRLMTYKDYYILFYDLSQIVLEVEYETEDPRTTVRFVNNFAKPSPVIRKDLLDRYYHEFGGDILTIASSLVNSKINDSLIKLIFGKLTKTNVLKNIGNKSYGVTIYKNMNNQNIARIDEIRPGDVLCIRQAKFTNHKGLSGITSRSTNVGSGDEPLAAVITDYDSKKDKLKVIEQDTTGHIRKASYKLTDMKSGKIRVFRVVGRDYIEW